MRVLLTNDDGIHAPGIVALHDALAAVSSDFDQPFADELLTVAPLTVQSATSHGVTFSEPLMVTDVRVHGEMSGIAVDGRPADCVKLALSTLWRDRFGKGDRPDLIISGMNAGANVGINVIYSGTVAAAIEGAFLGIPAIAVSLHLGRGRPLFDVAAAHARRAIEKICAESVPGPHTCLNVNIPRCEESGTSYSQAQAEQAARIAGSALSDISRTPENEIGLDASDPHDPRAELPLAVCPMNAHGIIDRFEERTSPGGQSYYWAAGGGLDFHNTDAGTDVHQLFERRITVTPLHYDLTEYGAMHHWRERLE